MAVIGSILSWIGTTLFTGTYAWVGWTLVSTLVSTALNAIFSDKGRDTGYTSGTRANTRSTEEYVKIIYGEVRVGGNMTVMESVGNNNDDLWFALGLGEGICDSLVTLYIDDQEYSELKQAHQNKIGYWFVDGSPTQEELVTPGLTNLYGAIHSVAGWRDSMKNTALLVMSLDYDMKYFNSVPNITAIIKGKKVYNFETGITEYSNNVVLCLYDYMTNTRYGLGISRLKIDLDSWIIAKDEMTTKGWTYNRPIMDGMSASDVIADMCKHGRLEMVKREDRYFLYVLDYSSPVMYITDEHVAHDDSTGKAAIKVDETSRFDIPSGVRISFPDADLDYIIDPRLIGEDSGGRVDDIELLGCTNLDQAIEAGSYLLKRQQLVRSITGTFRGDCVSLEPSDFVNVNLTEMGIENWEMRVQTVQYLASGVVVLQLNKEDPQLYFKNYIPLKGDLYQSSLPNVYATPPLPVVTSDDITEEIYDFRLRKVIRLNVHMSFSSSSYPIGWINKVEVWISVNDGEDYRHLYDVDPSDFFIDNVQEGKMYYIKLIPVSIHGVKPDFDDVSPITYSVVGYSNTRPGSVGELNIVIHSGNNITLHSIRKNEADIELYEFRLGVDWPSGVFLAASRSPILSITGVKPGEHYFTCNTLGTNGLYGEWPQIAYAKIKDPPDGWSHGDPWQVETDDFTDPGALFFNTEINGDGNLICSHSEKTYGVLDFYEYITSIWRLDEWTGYYTTPDEKGGVSLLQYSGTLVLEDNGIYGKCLYFSGNADGLFGSNADFTCNTFTLGFILKILEIKNMFICHMPNYALDITIEEIDGEAYLKFLVWTSITKNDYIMSLTKIEVDTWYQLAFSYDNETMKIFINGILDNSKKHSYYTLGFQSLTDIYFGVNPIRPDSNYDDMLGYIDEIIWCKDYVLTDAQVRQLYLETDPYTGYYVTKIIDKTASIAAGPDADEVLFYCLADTEIVSDANQWDALLPTQQETGREIGLTTKSWNDIFDYSGGGNIEIKLVYISAEDAPSDWPNVGCSEQKRLEIQSAIVHARFFQVVITIRDFNKSTSIAVNPLSLYFCTPV